MYYPPITIKSRWKPSPFDYEEDRETFYCEVCGEELHEDEVEYGYDGEILCHDCRKALDEQDEY